MKFTVGSTSSGLKNSTFIQYSFTLGTCAVTMQFKQSGTSTLFTLSGTSCSLFTFSFTPKASLGVKALNSTYGTGGTICRLQWNSLEWSWCTARLTAFTISYSAGTITIHNTASTWSFIDPITNDGANGCTANAASCSAALTTGRNNDVFIIIERSGASSTGCSASPPTDNLASHLTYTLRNNLAQGTSEACEFYATWTSNGAVTFTCNQASSARIACGIMSVKNANINNIFDPGASADCTKAFSGSGTGVSCSITTTNAHDLLIASVTGNVAASWVITLPTGFSGVVDTAGNSVQVDIGQEIVSTIQSNVAIAFSWSLTNVGGVEIVDSVMQFSPDFNTFNSCTFASSSAPTCALLVNPEAGDSMLIGVETQSSSTTVSSITDTQSLTYALQVQKNTQAVSDTEWWLACGTATAAAMTVTVHLSGSGTGEVFAIAMHPSFCTVTTSTASASSTTPSVASFTPTSPSICLGLVGESSVTPVSITAGTGYNAGQITAPAGYEYGTNYGTAETLPFTLGGIVGWNEAGICLTSSYSFTPTKTMTYTQSVQADPGFGLTNTLSYTHSVNIAPSYGVSKSLTYSQSVNIAPAFGLAATLLYTQSLAHGFAYFVSYLYNYTQSVAPAPAYTVSSALTYAQSITNIALSFSPTQLYSYTQSAAADLDFHLTAAYHYAQIFLFGCVGCTFPSGGGANVSLLFAMLALSTVFVFFVLARRRRVANNA